MKLNYHFERLAKLLIICIIYIISLIVISPVVDHMFGKLDKDESNGLILSEIISQIILISIIWYYYSLILKQFIKVYLHENIDGHEVVIDVVTAVGLIGLQYNMIQKLEYITHEHPFRVFKFLEDH
tara:strand:+ start:7664 stop:8041 length:378 start_codon:yes stop_codon:yes gene_type:complete